MSFESDHPFPFLQTVPNTERFCCGQREDFPSSLTADNSCFCLINIRHSLFSALSQSVGAAAHTLSASSTSSHPTSAKLKARKHSAHTLTQSNDDDDDGGGEEVTQIHVDRSEAEMEKLRRKQKSGRLTHTYPRTRAHAHSFCLAATRSKINASLSFFCSDGHKPRIAAGTSPPPQDTKPVLTVPIIQFNAED